VAQVSGRLTLKFHASICLLSPLAKKEKKIFSYKKYEILKGEKLQ
jgi:hypothetical protein